MRIPDDDPRRRLGPLYRTGAGYCLKNRYPNDPGQRLHWLYRHAGAKRGGRERGQRREAGQAGAGYCQQNLAAFSAG